MKRIGLVHIFTLSLSLSSFYGADKVYSQGIGVSVEIPAKEPPQDRFIVPPVNQLPFYV